LACGADTPGTLSGRWTAHDPESAITLYRYAIGTTPAGTDVINWTNTPDTSFARTGLSLIAGHTYYVSVKARNEGGLWSEAGVSSGVIAGTGTCPNAIFEASPLAGNAPLTVSFEDLSS
jgi:PKD repeat protein